jgi:tetratricopeptide (TPR) repeat protein
MSLRTQIGLLVAVVAAVYVNSLFNGFTLDDELYILRNPQVTAPSISLLCKPNPASSVFRPVTFATLAGNWAMAGYRPFGYHLVNLLLHAAVTALVLLALRQLLEATGGWELVPFAAALLFAVHPIHTEAVSSIVGRSELLAAGFLLAAWLLHLRDHPLPALGAFALALLSKESAVGLLPVLLAGDWSRGRLKPWTRYAAMAALTALYAGLLWKVQGGRFGSANVSVLDNPLVLLPAHLRVLNAVRVAWKYLGLLVFPAVLSSDYSYNEILLYSDLGHTLPALLAFLALLAAWAVAVWKRQTAYAAAGALYFAGFAATSNLLTLTGTILGERLAYFPSVGFCLLAAALWQRFAGSRRGLAAGLLAAVVAACGARTVLRNRDWRDNAALYSAALRAAPGSAKMHSFRGSLYLGEGRLDPAREEFAKALDIFPGFPEAVEGMAFVEARSGNQEKALELMEKALRMSVRKDIDYDYRAVNLAALEVQMGRLDQALELLNKEIAVAPGYSRAWSNRAALLFRLGRNGDARRDAQEALRLDRSNLQARNILDRLSAPSHGAPLR